MSGVTTIRFTIFLKTSSGNCSGEETIWNPALLIKISIPRKYSSTLFTTSLQLSGFDRSDFMKNVLSPFRTMPSGKSFLSNHYYPIFILYQGVNYGPSYSSFQTTGDWCYFSFGTAIMLLTLDDSLTI